MLTIPDGVSQHLKDELERYQNQICILLRNHQILSIRLKKEPENEKIKNQLSKVQDYLIQFSNEQRPVIEAIRAEVKVLNKSVEVEAIEDSAKSESNRTSTTSIKEEPAGSPLAVTPSAVTPKSEQSDVSAAASDDDNTSHVGSSGSKKLVAADGDDVHSESATSTEGTIKAPPAKRRRKNGTFTSSKSGSATRSPSPKADPTLDDSLLNGAYPGHVSTVDKFMYQEPPRRVARDDDPIERPETVLQKCSQEQFLLNIGLLTPPTVETIYEHRKEYRKRTFDFRNMTYIPEISDKKHRISYNYLSADLNSPPLLRTRQRRPPITVSASSWIRPMSSRATTSTFSRSGSVSRASTPDMDLKRTHSAPSATPSAAQSKPASPANSANIVNQPKKAESRSNEELTPPPPPPPPPPPQAEAHTPRVRDLDKKKMLEKERLEGELSILNSKVDEVEKSLNEINNRRTVATRKDRSRLSELQEQQTSLQTVKKEIMKKLENLESSKK